MEPAATLDRVYAVALACVRAGVKPKVVHAKRWEMWALCAALNERTGEEWFPYEAATVTWEAQDLNGATLAKFRVCEKRN